MNKKLLRIMKKDISLLLLSIIALTLTAISTILPAIAIASPIYNKISINTGSTVAFEGDSLTYGLDATGTGVLPPINGSQAKRSMIPFPEEFGKLVRGELKIENRGYPGDRTVDGIARWKNPPPANLVFIMYGTNDFGNYGKHPGGSLNVSDYRKCLEILIQRRLESGSRVILLTPPPVQNKSVEQSLSLFRKEMIELGHNLKIPVINTSDLIESVERKWTDGIHLSAESNIAIAKSLSGIVTVGE